MRRRIVVFLVTILTAFVFLIYSISTFLQLLFENGMSDAIHHSDLPAPGSKSHDRRPRLIPKIIHQTYINESIPIRWLEPQKQCRDLHKDYEYKLWTDAMSRDFIATEYSWFLEAFDSYAFPIQRADAIRYFVLAHYGGTYIDLDYGCNRRLDPLNIYPAWLHRTLPTGISNDAMGSVPHHPFFLYVLDSLESYNRDWKLGYITVMYSTGPLFLSVLWKQWISSGHNVGDEIAGGRVRVLLHDDYQGRPWSFFSSFVGSSWHGDDVKFFLRMRENWLWLTAAGLLGLGLVSLVMWWLYVRLLLLMQRRRSSTRTTQEGKLYESLERRIA